MPIHVPGIPHMYRRRKLRPQGRDPVALLSLTAMIDMFAVLAIFLLQSYASTGKPIDLPKNIELPSSQHIREANPAHVVTLSRDKVYVDGKEVATLTEVQEQPSWLIPKLFSKIQEVVATDEKLLAMQKLNPAQIVGEEVNSGVPYHKRYTVQADRDSTFFSIKKILYTLTEAGIIEINFTVVYEKNNT